MAEGPKKRGCKDRLIIWVFTGLHRLAELRGAGCFFGVFSVFLAVFTWCAGCSGFLVLPYFDLAAFSGCFRAFPVL